jgi:hypothetical protein
MNDDIEHKVQYSEMSRIFFLIFGLLFLIITIANTIIVIENFEYNTKTILGKLISIFAPAYFSHLFIYTSIKGMSPRYYDSDEIKKDKK